MAHGSASKTVIVPLFPLPNVVLMPRAVLPLHIFEERYKTMTAESLQGDRRIAMALLKPGWETNYYSKPSIEPVVCIGEILTHERLEGGKYNFLLRGQQRAKVLREIAGHEYRLAELEPLEEILPLSDLSEERATMLRMLRQPQLSKLPGIEQFRELADGLLPLPDLADLLAFHLLDDIPFKQQLLSEPDVRQRVKLTLGALAELTALLPMPKPRISGIPSMN